MSERRFTHRNTVAESYMTCELHREIYALQARDERNERKIESLVVLVSELFERIKHLENGTTP